MGRLRIAEMIAAAALLQAPAWGDAAADHFAKGAYFQAADAALEAGGADGHAFAARALLSEFVTRLDDAEADLVDRAVDEASAAIALDPGHVEGRLQLAIALSMQARPMSVREALASGNGERARDLAEAVLEVDPDNYYAHGFLAVWHVEVRRRGGAIGASVMGASVKKGRAHYEICVGLAPDDASVHWQYARALLAHNPKKFGAEAEAVLQRALDAGVDDALEAVSQERAQMIAELMATDVKTASQRAADML